ncbi:CPBP family glutamic-type intramembrane protease [Caulobacter sp. RL271]|jgi:predicted Abi (CAAX) family protease|uniref:CPBP family glutamic-type intramembrane protease n=1 Tax=Caulobacter segnis TaxID=88688 RepID=A0ABY4ZV25_9CAUL|nr:CPBP family glutamic-type intramembrane protease [Caulobacter segnis]USQ96667.1 CPBP family glutamic-type intramembrane protease [Caulobacter segnis]
MAASFKVYQASLLASLRTLPSPRGWGFCLAVAAVTLAIMAAIGFATGLYRLTPTQPGLPLRLLTVLVIPALGEEIPFRGLLTPGPGESRRPWLAVALSTTLYTLWHVVEGLTFLKSAAPVFLRPDFLLCCAVLGLGCAITRLKTGSLWPAVLLHGALVVVWQTWLGGVSALS